MDIFENGSFDSNQNGGNFLEELMLDEFGFVIGGLGDGIDMGGKLKGDKIDVILVWSELKMKVGKECKRLFLVCIVCWCKKIRCLGEKLVCKYCLWFCILCVYKVIVCKVVLRIDYMVMLDKWLKRMEECIIKVVLKLEQDFMVVLVIRVVVKLVILGIFISIKGVVKKCGVDEVFGLDLDNWVCGILRFKLDGFYKFLMMLV